jgi:aminoglycoside 6'-N-acetyltransferase I
MALLTIRPVQPTDADAWLHMRCQLWPACSEVEHREEMARFLEGRAREPAEVLVAESDGHLVGFAELSIRPCAEGCDTDRVAYLEGWFVSPGERRKGIGRALAEAAEDWGRDAGCLELGSDTSPDNVVSISAHIAVGFESVGTVLCFRRRL